MSVATRFFFPFLERGWGFGAFSPSLPPLFFFESIANSKPIASFSFLNLAFASSITEVNPEKKEPKLLEWFEFKVATDFTKQQFQEIAIILTKTGRFL